MVGCWVAVCLVGDVKVWKSAREIVRCGTRRNFGFLDTFFAQYCIYKQICRGASHYHRHSSLDTVCRNQSEITKITKIALICTVAVVYRTFAINNERHINSKSRYKLRPCQSTKDRRSYLAANEIGTGAGACLLACLVDRSKISRVCFCQIYNIYAVRPIPKKQ